MLESVKSFISSVADVPFSTYFTEYILYVQDQNIEDELSFLKHRNTLNINVVNKVIDQGYKGLMQL